MMPKERKPGWEYFYSEILKKEFALHKETGWVYVEGGVKYSPEEIKILNEGGGTLDIETHRVKSILGGEIVKFTPNAKPEIKPPEEKATSYREGELEIW